MPAHTTHRIAITQSIAVGAPTFGSDGAIYNAHLLIDERAVSAATVATRGLTDPEGTFFRRGTPRPVGSLQGLRCRPEENVEGGGSCVAAPDGELLLRLPGQAAGVGVFTLGDRHFEWHPE